MTLNVDGGLSKIGDRGASAVICRDRQGMFLGASAVIFEGLLDPTILEAQAVTKLLLLLRIFMLNPCALHRTASR